MCRALEPGYIPSGTYKSRGGCAPQGHIFMQNKIEYGFSTSALLTLRARYLEMGEIGFWPEHCRKHAWPLSVRSQQLSLPSNCTNWQRQMTLGVSGSNQPWLRITEVAPGIGLSSLRVRFCSPGRFASELKLQELDVIRRERGNPCRDWLVSKVILGSLQNWENFCVQAFSNKMVLGFCWWRGHYALVYCDS